MKKLYLDIETSPTLGYFYGRRKLNISPDQVVHNGFILCYQYALDDGPVVVESLRHKKFPLKPHDDKDLVRSLAKLVGEADVVVAHNGDRFDLARLKARMATYGMRPFHPPQTVDTLKVCRRFFMFEANSLDSVCQELGLGRKFHSGGYGTTLACMRGDQKSWQKLLKYGKHDVVLLRDLYHRLKPWMTNHPNWNLYEMTEASICPVCGSNDLKRNGTRRTLTMTYQRYQCAGCGHWVSDRNTDLSLKKRKTILRGG